VRAAAPLRFDPQAPWGRYAPGPFHARLIGWAQALPASMPRLSQRLAVLLRRPVKYGVDHALDVQVWGLRLRLAPRGNIAEAKLLFAPQFYELGERAFMSARLGPGATFVDVGANVGAYSYWAHRCLQGQGRILAVEPDPEMRRRLLFNLHSNAMHEVEVLDCALSDRQGEAVLYVNDAQRGENTIAPEQAQAVGGARITQQVPMDTLLHALSSRAVSRIDMLKIDIEGHELAVLSHFFAHAPESLWPRVILAEHKHEAASALQQLFEARGYARALRTRLNDAWQR
jgi:FkbM family methyltransferase